MGRLLLVDSVNVKLHQLTEAAGTGDYIFRGKFAQADMPTANRRIYSRNLWEREINRLNGKVIEGKVFGELDHPEDGKTKLQRVAVLIQDLGIDKHGQVIGSMKILNTSMGRELKAIVDGGGAVGVSSRGYGSVRMNEDGNAVVQDDFTLLTFDPVADPAEETAYPELQKTEEPSDKAIGDDSQDVCLDAVESKNIDKNIDKNIVTTESIDRNKLKTAIKTAKGVYATAIKESSHRDALSRAVDEGYKIIGQGYDLKDFAVDVAAEVMNIPKPTVEEKQDINMDPTEILKLIKTTVSESIDSLLAEKDHALNEAKNQIMSENKKFLGVQKELSEAKDTISKLHDVVKELGYGLYLQQHLGRHPKLKQIKESIGDLCMIESLESLQNKVKVHISEVSRVMEAEEAKLKKLHEDISSANGKIKLLENDLRTVTEERDEAASIGLEHAAALYLEQRIQGNPYQVEMRRRFKEMKEKSKEAVDRLLSEYKGRRINESGDFHRIRRSLAHRPKDAEHDNLVENHIKTTNPITDDSLMVMGETFNMKEIKRLSGIR